MKRRGLIPNFCILVSVSDLYIPTIGLPILLYCVADWSWEYINRSQIHECRNWETWPRSFISGNICFEFSIRFAFAVCSALIHSKINSLAPFLFSIFLNMIYNVVVLHSLNICIKLHTLNMHESRTWLHDQNIEVPTKRHISAISSWSGLIWWEMYHTCMKKLSKINSSEAEFMNVQFRWGLWVLEVSDLRFLYGMWFGFQSGFPPFSLTVYSNWTQWTVETVRGCVSLKK